MRGMTKEGIKEEKNGRGFENKIHYVRKVIVANEALTMESQT